MEETIGERLRRVRTERCLSQRAISGPGVSFAYISRIEAGMREPSMKALRLLAPRLGVSAEYLETGYDETPTDALLRQVRERLGDGASLGFEVGEDGIRAWWNRVYPEPTEEYAQAGFASGLSGDRSETAETLTAVLRAILRREDENDAADALVVAVAQTKREGRPMAEAPS
jgi:transcriptional regulator with XRE-family HTH domain